MGFLAPKPATNTSNNQAYGQLSSAYTPTIGLGNSATNYLAGMLGVPGGDSAGANTAFSNYKAQAGYAPALQALQSGVTQGAAAQGMLNSGATDKALLTKGSQLDQQTYGNYLQQLAGLSGIGEQAGGIVSGAGQQSSGTGGSPSAAGTIGSLVGGIASIFGGSDRRVKHDINRVAEFPDGLGIYTFRYVPWFDPSQEKRIGVMADEVEKIRPWALGPSFDGLATVNYGAL